MLSVNRSSVPVRVRTGWRLHLCPSGIDRLIQTILPPQPTPLQPAPSLNSSELNDSVDTFFGESPFRFPLDVDLSVLMKEDEPQSASEPFFLSDFSPMTFK
jgi:hypothetical protein